MAFYRVVRVKEIDLRRVQKWTAVIQSRTGVQLWTALIKSLNFFSDKEQKELF